VVSVSGEMNTGFILVLNSRQRDHDDDDDDDDDVEDDDDDNGDDDDDDDEDDDDDGDYRVQVVSVSGEMNTGFILVLNSRRVREFFRRVRDTMASPQNRLVTI
jgi:ABC-type Zn2+ transport system substrate-binding protein/surface adhesin